MTAQPRVAKPDPQPRFLLIVSRARPDLIEAFGYVGGRVTILDRRHGERRAKATGGRRDQQRRRQRRRHSVDGMLARQGYALVTL